MTATLAAALEDVRAFITRYVVLTPEQAVACALWIAHTYALDATDITPYLAVTSPEKRSGKSLLLEVLGSVANKPWFAVRPSEAVLYRKIEKDCPTLLLDEVDTIWSSKSRDDDEGLRALLNAGFRRHGSTVPRCVGPTLKLRDFATFCPKALGGIGDLPDTISDRCIPIRMERKRREDAVARWRWKVVQADANSVRSTVEATVSAITARLEQANPELPDELDDRSQDAWEPLLAIADYAGDEWAAPARAAALILMSSRVDEAPIGAQLLADIRNSFNGDGRLATKSLVTLLTDIEESPWGDWGGKPISGRRLAGMLRPYGVSPRKEGGWRGYFASDFRDAWARYAPEAPSGEAALTAESGASGVSGALNVEGVSGDPLHAQPRCVKDVTDREGGGGQTSLTPPAQSAQSAQTAPDPLDPAPTAEELEALQEAVRVPEADEYPYNPDDEEVPW